MEMMDSLKKVCLENNGIKDGGAIALSKALEDNDTLLSLHLESNEISCEGASALGEMLSNKFKLSKLNLNNNPIGDEGFIKIAEGLNDIETLRIITLANTQVTKACIPALSQSLQNKPRNNLKLLHKLSSFRLICKTAFFLDVVIDFEFFLQAILDQATP